MTVIIARKIVNAAKTGLRDALIQEVVLKEDTLSRARPL